MLKSLCCHCKSFPFTCNGLLLSHRPPCFLTAFVSSWNQKSNCYSTGPVDPSLTMHQCVALVSQIVLSTANKSAERFELLSQLRIMSLLFVMFCANWWTALSFRTVASTIGKPVYCSSSFIAAGFPIQNMLSTFENLLLHFLIVSNVMVGIGEVVTYFAAVVPSRISKSCHKKGNSTGHNFKPNPTTPNRLLMWLDLACLA